MGGGGAASAGARAATQRGGATLPRARIARGAVDEEPLAALVRRGGRAGGRGDRRRVRWRTGTMARLGASACGTSRPDSGGAGTLQGSEGRQSSTWVARGQRAVA